MVLHTLAISMEKVRVHQDSILYGKHKINNSKYDLNLIIFWRWKHAKLLICLLSRYLTKIMVVMIIFS